MQNTNRQISMFNRDGYTVIFAPNNPWRMPAIPLPLPWTSQADPETVRADLTARFPGAIISHFKTAQ